MLASELVGRPLGTVMLSREGAGRAKGTCLSLGPRIRLGRDRQENIT